jgi:hypothetical protein
VLDINIRRIGMAIPMARIGLARLLKAFLWVDERCATRVS